MDRHGASVEHRVRLATGADRASIAAVLAAGFADEELHTYMLPGREQYTQEYVRAWRECVDERWWDYSKIWLVAVASEAQRGKRDIGVGEGRVVGVAEWQRSGAGWEHVWGSWGWCDPRNTISYALRYLHQWREWKTPNPSKRQSSSADHSPLSKLNFGPRIGPFMKELFPHEAYWELCTLATDSSYRQQGVGKSLADWGLGRAKQESLPAGVVAAKGLEDFYRKCGFEYCTGVASEVKIGGITNPLTERGLGGGAVLWTMGAEQK